MGLFLALVAGGVGPASAALAPIYESIREMKAILDDPALPQALGGVAAVMSITDNGKGGYVVSTDRCSVTVNVVTVPPDPSKPMMVGPRQFTLEFEKSVCK